MYFPYQPFLIAPSALRNSSHPLLTDDLFCLCLVDSRDVPAYAKAVLLLVGGIVIAAPVPSAPVSPDAPSPAAGHPPMNAAR